MMKKLFFAVILFFSFSCLQKDLEFIRSYISGYYGVNRIELWDSTEDKETPTITIFYETDYHVRYNGGDQILYDELCEKHGDMNYSRKINLCRTGPYKMECIGTDFLSIDLISNSDFDYKHLAGESLGDIVTFKSKSLKPFIDSAYTLECGVNDKCGGLKECFTPVVGHLTSLSPDQLSLLFNGASIGILEFDFPPDMSKSHTFTVTMTTDDGRVFEASIDMELL